MTRKQGVTVNNDRSRNQQQRSGAQELDEQLFTETRGRIDHIRNPEETIVEVPWDDVLPEDTLGVDVLPEDAPKEEIPSYYIECPLCLGEGCWQCDDLGALDPQYWPEVVPILAELDAVDQVFGRLEQSLPDRQRHVAFVAIATEKWRWIVRWREQGVISDRDIARVRGDQLPEIGFPIFEKSRQA
jgi:hypothetical protein